MHVLNFQLVSYVNVFINKVGEGILDHAQDQVPKKVVKFNPALTKF